MLVSLEHYCEKKNTGLDLMSGINVAVESPEIDPS